MTPCKPCAALTFKGVPCTKPAACVTYANTDYCEIHQRPPGTVGPPHSEMTDLELSDADEVDVKAVSDKLTSIQAHRHLGLISHGSLNGRALRVPKDKIIIVLSNAGAVTSIPVALVTLQDEQHIKDAEQGRLRLHGVHIYSRMFLPGEKMPDMRLNFNDKDVLQGLFGLPIPRDQTLVDIPYFLWKETARARFDNTDLLHAVDSKYVPGAYKTTLRSLIHRKSCPPGVYVVCACRTLNSRVGADQLPKLRDLNFRMTYRQLVGNDFDWKKAMEEQGIALFKGLDHANTLCARQLIAQNEPRFWFPMGPPNNLYSRLREVARRTTW
jgi:hypothetical protein